MASGPGRNRRLESAVSILLLVVLFLIALAVLIKQADVDMTRFGLGAAAQPDSQKAPDLAALASGPPGRTPDAFKELSSPLVYTAGNLYEKINGKAPLYLDAGFLKLFTQRFVSRTDENLWMEIYLYDMAGLKNAFSVYSVQKRADVETLSTMQFAYKTTNALYFVHGRYYVELLGSEPVKKLSSGTYAYGSLVRSRMAAAGHPSSLRALPRWGAERFEIPLAVRWAVFARFAPRFQSPTAANAT